MNRGRKSMSNLFNPKFARRFSPSETYPNGFLLSEEKDKLFQLMWKQQEQMLEQRKIRGWSFFMKVISKIKGIKI